VGEYFPLNVELPERLLADVFALGDDDDGTSAPS
jgi:hypothetical protein